MLLTKHWPGISGLLILSIGSCGRGREVAGTYEFSGVMQMSINDCTVQNPPGEWKTKFSVADAGGGRFSLFEEAYECTVVAVQHESILDASGASCPITALGFVRQDFSVFLWNVSTRTLEYSSILSFYDKSGTVHTYCAHVEGAFERVP